MKRKQKKFLSIIVFFVFTFTLIVCLLLQYEMPIHKEIKNFLLENGIKESKITYLGEYKKIDYVYSSPTISSEELKKHIEEILETHAEIIEIKDRQTVQEGDVIVVDYVVRYENDIVFHIENDSLLVGSGFYNPFFEEAVVGLTVNNPVKKYIPAQETTEQFNEGELLEYQINIKSINFFKTYQSTDSYIHQYYNVGSENEFLEYCEENLLSMKRKEAEKEAEKTLFTSISNVCRFSIDMNEVILYSEKIINSHKQMAYLYDLEFEEYIEKGLNMSEKEFYEQCYNEGESEIKKILIIGAISKKQGFSFKGREEDFDEKGSKDAIEEPKDAQAYFSSLMSQVIDFYIEREEA